MVKDLKELFCEMNVVSMVLLGVGLVLFAVFAFFPKLKFFNLIAFACVVAGVCARHISGANVMQTLYLCIMCAVVLTPFLCVIVIKAKKEKLLKKIRSAQRNTTVPTNGELSEINLKFFEGKRAVAYTDLKPFGKIKLEGELFEAKTEGEFISVGTKVKITKIDKDNNIFVGAVGKNKRK